MNPDNPTLDLTGFLEPVFEVFRHPNIAIAISFALLILALLILFWFALRHMVPMLRTLHRVKKQLRTIPDEDAFHTDFARIDEVISKERLLKHGWNEFKETLIMPDPDTGGPIKNTARPSAYLNVSSVASELNLPYYQAIPNYFVGLGLLFTFFGLVAALYFASQGVAGDVEAAKAALTKLLHAATFKFSTSIAGLLSSILLSFTVKWLILRVQLYFDRLCQLLEARIIFVTPEWIGIQQLKELKKQNIQLERFNTDFAVEVAKALETRLNNTLGPTINKAVQPMAAAIDNMARNFSDMSQDAMTQMVGEFKSSLEGATDNKMHALADTLSSLQEALQSTIKSMGDSSGSFGDRINHAADRMEKLLEGASQSMQASVSQSASHLEEILGQTSQSLRANAEQISGNLRAAISSISNELNKQVTGAAANWTSELSASANEIKGALSQAGDSLSGKVDQASNQLASVITPFAERIQSLDSTLRATDERLKAQLEGFDASISRLRDILSHMDQSLKHIQQAGAPISGTAERFASAAQQIEAVSQSILQTQTKLAEMADAIRDGADRVQESWVSYTERFEKVDNDLSKVFGQIQEGTDAYHNRILEYVKKVDDHFSHSLGILGGGIEELKEVVEELSDSVERLRPGIA